MRRAYAPALSISVLVTQALVVPSVHPAFAGTQEGAVIALHAKAYTAKGTCTTNAPQIPCGEYTTTWPLRTATDVYLVVARADSSAGITGLSCGVQYDPNVAAGLLVTWTGCTAGIASAGSYGDWPAPGGGIRMAWTYTDQCQRTVYAPDGVHAVAGSFYVYAYGPDVLSITPNYNPLSGAELGVVDCSIVSTYFSLDTRNGSVGFGGLPGYNPCVSAISTESASWGNLKQKFVK